MIKKITFIGSGNVATQLSIAFKRVNKKIVQIISKNQKSGEKLAQKTKAEFSDSLKKILKTDLIIICVNDDNISDVINSLPNISVVHTSGSTNIDAFTTHQNHGVIYPLQSLNKEIKTDFKNIPICIESNNKKFQEEIINLSKEISNNVILLNSNKRQTIHLAAIIASNFSNFCYSIAKKILDQEKIDFSLLKPLIIYTAEKTLKNDPLLNQTGPAKRGDQKIIKKHLSILKDENHRKIYKLLSKYILTEYEK